MIPPRARRPRRRWLRWLLGLLVVFGLLCLARTWVDRSGRQFLREGTAIVASLDALAEAVRARDFDAVAASYSESFSGRLSGLNHLAPAAERDGVQVTRFDPPAAPADRQAAVAEWRHYAAGFASIDQLEMHVHRIEDWSRPGAFVATVRFEVIGTLQGAGRPSVDRGLLRLRFAAAGDARRIAASELIEGERVSADRPHFDNVAAAAGVDFENRYYPAFLTTPLEFAMLRYGPAGISAVDFDNDGRYDLFVPDGVESRLFWSRGDGGFDDVTAAAGLGGLDGVSVGVFADYDNDGYKDFFVSRTFTPNQLFHSNGPDADGRITFTDVTTQAGIGADCCTTVASWADVDNDGWLDLYVGRYLEPRTQIPTTFYARNGEPNQLYRNRGDGTFANVTESAGVGELGLCLGTVFADYDDDGDADLYVVNDFGRNTLYRNDSPTSDPRDATADGVDGAVRFTDVTVDTGSLAYGAGMNASFGDYDNDGRLDIYVTNIRSEYAWFGESPMVRQYLANSIWHGVWWQDWPLYLEIVRQSGFRMGEIFQQMGSGNTLLHSLGPGADGQVRFEDVTWETRTNPPGWFWGASFADFDNDGWQDIYAANGWVYNEPDTEIELDFFAGVVNDQRLYKTGHFFDPSTFGNQSWHGWERNRHLRNDGQGPDGHAGFTEIGLAAGTGLIANSRGVAVADFWNRGVLDIAVATSTDRHALLRNEVGVGRHWLQVELVGAAGELPDGANRDAVGTRLVLRTTDGGQQIREVVLGDGYGSQNTLRQHFGLGERATPVDLEVRWPRSGRVQRFAGVGVDRVIEITEGVDELVETRRPPPAAVETAGAQAPP